ncbi:MAG: NADH-quinone oxidoreductase subunit L [Nitrososphaerales archaeon]|nr:NADH-quinone oxidoreductase subunit L [Nitrososphaerales archaeon]
MAAIISSYYIWLVFVAPFVGALLVPLVGKSSRIRDYLAVASSFVSAFFALQLLIPTLQGQTLDPAGPTSIPWISALSINIGVLHDPFTIIVSNVVAWVSFLIMVYSLGYMRGDGGLARYWFFMNFFIGSMQLIVLSDNFLSMFVGWEGVGLCSFALIGFWFTDEKDRWVGTPGQRALGEEQAYPPSHAGMKAFVMTRIGDLAFLVGIIILFIYSGTFSFTQLAQSTGWATRLAQSGLLVPVALLIFGGAVGKSAQFPLHEWLPDAMAGPAPVSALIHAATMVKAGVVLVARVGPLFYFALAYNPSLIQPFFVTVAWIGAFTAFLAATQALVGYELKKILAYSTVSQVGYMMMALGLTGLSNDFAQGLSAGLYHLMSHAIFKACLFMAAGVLIHTSESKYINDMGGLRGKLKITFVAFLIAAASLSGIPPFTGFWSKDAVLATAWDAGQMGLFAVGAMTAGLTAFYSFRMVGMIFFGKEGAKVEEAQHEGHAVREMSPLLWVPYTILAVGTLFIGLVSLPLGVENTLEWASNTYLSSLFPGLSGKAVAVPGFNAVSASITGGFVVLGFALAAVVYIMRKFPPAKFAGSTGVAHSIYIFLENRWYINAIYYKVFVNAPIAVANSTWVHFELNFLDRSSDAVAQVGIYLSEGGNWLDANVIDGIANGVSTVGQAISRTLRRLQSGVTQQYIFVFAVGVAVLMILLLLASGVKLI